MGDRVYAHFDIGGLTKAQMDNICAMLDSRDTVPANDDTVMAIYTAIQDIYLDETDIYDIDGHHTLRLIQYEANYGDHAFDDFKVLCRNHRLAYSCYWSAGGDFSAGFVWWHPGFDGFAAEIERATDGEQIVVTQGQMIRFLHWFNSGGSEKYGLTLEQAIGVLYTEPGASPSAVPEVGFSVLNDINRALSATISTT